MITIDNISKYFGNQEILNNISLTINQGDIFGLIGKSGSGKSTLLRCINGLEKCDSGKIIVNDTIINHLNNRELRSFRKKIGMIFQEFSLIERKSVKENISIPMECWNYNVRDINDTIIKLINTVGLSDKINTKARYLSGGQKQRVAIARALTLEPTILLCDEPTSALDPSTTKDILKLLKYINKNLNITIILVTHEMEVIKEVCNKVAILDNGKIAEYGNVEDIFFKNSKKLQKIVGSTNLIDINNSKFILEIFLNKHQNNKISNLALFLNNSFKILYTNTELYGNTIYHRYLIEVCQKDFKNCLNYLDENNIYYQTLKGGL